jgi:hypothetical protein
VFHGADGHGMGSFRVLPKVWGLVGRKSSEGVSRLVCGIANDCRHCDERSDDANQTTVIGIESAPALCPSVAWIASSLRSSQ